MSTIDSTLAKLEAEVTAGRMTLAEARGYLDQIREAATFVPPPAAPPAPAPVETGISDLNHAVDAVMRQDGLSRGAALEFVASMTPEALASTVTAEKVRYVAGLDIERQLQEANSPVSREQLGLAHAAHAAKLRNLGAAARDHLAAESAINGLRPDDIAELSDIDAMTVAGYAVPEAPSAPVVDVSQHPDFQANLAHITQLEGGES